MRLIKRLLRNKFTTAAAIAYALGCFVAEHVGMSPDYDLQNTLEHAAQWTKALAIVFGLLMAADSVPSASPLVPEWKDDLSIKWWEEILVPLSWAALAMLAVWAGLYGLTKLFNWALPAMFGPKFI